MTERIGDKERVDLPPDLAMAAEEFLVAGRKYREFLKKNYRDRLEGIVYVGSLSGELVLYTESPVYANAIRQTVLPKPGEQK